MTTASQITYCTSQARTGDLVRAAAAARPPVQRSPRSTFRPLTWLGRCTGPLPRQRAASCHS
jgi:hypothetical protein